MGKKTAPLQLCTKAWRQTEHWVDLAQAQHRANDVLRELAKGLLPGGVLHADASLRLHVLEALEQHAVELCSDANTDVLRQLYETVRDRSANVLADGPEGAARMQLVALRVLTSLLVKLDMPQRDARLVKVHVELLFKIMERNGVHAAAAPELCRCAAACLRRLEEAAPTLLLSGSKQLLDLARRETSAAAESFVMLAAAVVSHGAARCLDLKLGSGSSSDEEQAAHTAHRHAGAEAAAGRAARQLQQQQQQQAGQGEEEQEEAEQDAMTVLSSIDVRALVLGDSCSELVTGGSSGARILSPVDTLGTLEGAVAFASLRTDGSSEGHGSPKEQPGSPRGVASVIGTVSTFDDSSRALSAAVRSEPVPVSGAGASSMPAPSQLAPIPASIAASEVSGSVQLDSTAAQPLLSPAGHGLRHFRVPQHLHWPDALAHTAICVYITPEAQQDLQHACLEFLAAMPRLSTEGVACLTAALPPIMRLADLPPAQLQDALDAMLHSGRTLMLQAVLKLYPEVPPGFGSWKGALVDRVLMMVNGPHAQEQRVIAITWCLVQHHAMVHSGKPSLFLGNWRQLLPHSDDPAQLLSLKVKALSACLAVGIGRPEEICPMVFAWDGFWQAHPTDQQQRLATYALRMLGSAAMSYAALPGHVQLARRSPSGEGRPHFVKACLVSACLQLVATRPQYLPAVDAFLANCGSCCRSLQQSLLNAIDALFSAAATGTFASLQPREGQQLLRKQRSVKYGSSPPSVAADLATAGSGGSASSGGSTSKSGLGGMLQRMRSSMSKKFGSTADAPLERSGSVLSSQASLPTPASPRAAGQQPQALETRCSGPLPTVAEGAPTLSLAAPQPPLALESWEAAEAWLWDSRTWANLSSHMLTHDPLAYRCLLLRLAHSGTDVLPMGGLRLLAAYANQYQGELPGHTMSARDAGSCVLAICQAAAMTHLLIGPAGTTAAAAAAASAAAAGASAGPNAAAAATACSNAIGSGASSSKPKGSSRGLRGRSRWRGSSEGSSVRGSSPASGALTDDGCTTPQWTLQQEEIAVAMQAVLSALTSRFPVENVRRRAQSFLDLLSNPSAWDLRLRMGTMAKMLGGYFSDAVSAAAYL